MIVVVVEPGVVMVAGPPTILVHVPLPLEGGVAAMVAVPGEAQMVWSGPALTPAGGAFTMTTTLSVEAVQGLLLMVQRRV